MSHVALRLMDRKQQLKTPPILSALIPKCLQGNERPSLSGHGDKDRGGGAEMDMDLGEIEDQRPSKWACATLSGKGSAFARRTAPS